MLPSYQLIEPFHLGAGPPYKVFKGTNLGTIDRAVANAVVQLGHFRKNGINNVITSYSIHYTKLYEEQVILFNPNEREMDIDGWSILDASKRKELLSGKIKSGDIVRISLSGNSALLGNNGGIITLLNRDGIKIDGVNYTKKQAKQSGKWIKF